MYTFTNSELKSSCQCQHFSEYQIDVTEQCIVHIAQYLSVVSVMGILDLLRTEIFLKITVIADVNKYLIKCNGVTIHFNFWRLKWKVKNKEV